VPWIVFIAAKSEVLRSPFSSKIRRFSTRNPVSTDRIVLTDRREPKVIGIGVPSRQSQCRLVSALFDKFTVKSIRSACDSISVEWRRLSLDNFPSGSSEHEWLQFEFPE
jgi:hypothetical protein